MTTLNQLKRDVDALKDKERPSARLPGLRESHRALHIAWGDGSEYTLPTDAELLEWEAAIPKILEEIYGNTEPSQKTN